VRRLDIVRFPAGGRGFPYALILQGDIAERLSSVVVAPIRPRGATPFIDILTPVLEIAGDQHLVLLHELAAVQRSNLGARIADARHLDWEIKRGLDRLLFEV
jgi:hypothetical protein